MYFYSLYNPSFWLSFGNPVPGIVSTFAARVAADGGIFEASACLEAQLNALNAIA